MKNFILLIFAVLILLLFCSCAENGDEIISEVDTSTTYRKYDPQYNMLDDDTIQVSSFSFDIPEEFSLLPNTEKPVVESADGYLEIMVDDKTETEPDYEKHIEETLAMYKSIAMNPSEIEDVSVGDFSAKRFYMTMADDEYKTINTICYFVEKQDLKADVLVMVRGENQKELSEVDTLVANIDFSK